MNYKVIGSCDHIFQFDLRKFEGRVFFTTDLHGCYGLLHEKLALSGFDSTKDILFIGGDLCDRGPDSKYVLDYLEEPWIHSIRGNHEQLFIEAYNEEWDGPHTRCLLINGGDWISGISEVQAKVIWQTFKELPLAMELLMPSGNKVGIVHAGVPYNDWDQFKKITKAELDWDGLNVCQWDRTQYEQQGQEVVKNIDLVFHGHSPTVTGLVEQYGNRVYCDLGSFFRDKISFMEIK